MGLYLGALLIGRIFASEIFASETWGLIFGRAYSFGGRGVGGGGGGLLMKFYGIFIT